MKIHFITFLMSVIIRDSFKEKKFGNNSGFHKWRALLFTLFKYNSVFLKHLKYNVSLKTRGVYTLILIL